MIVNFYTHKRLWLFSAGMVSGDLFHVNGPGFPVSLCALWSRVENWAFEKAATSPRTWTGSVQGTPFADWWGMFWAQGQSSVKAQGLFSPFLGVPFPWPLCVLFPSSPVYTDAFIIALSIFLLLFLGALAVLWCSSSKNLLSQASLGLCLLRVFQEPGPLLPIASSSLRSQLCHF